MFKKNILIYKSEQEAKFVHERISTTEKNFSELHTVFAAYARKLARLVRVTFCYLCFFI